MVFIFLSPVTLQKWQYVPISSSSVSHPDYAHEHFRIRPLYDIKIVWSLSIWSHHLFLSTETALNLVGKKLVCMPHTRLWFRAFFSNYKIKCRIMPKHWPHDEYLKNPLGRKSSLFRLQPLVGSVRPCTIVCYQCGIVLKNLSNPQKSWFVSRKCHSMWNYQCCCRI